MSEAKKQRRKHIVLTSHPGARKEIPVPIKWGAPTAAERGPVIGTITNAAHRNCIGTHAGFYSIYRALAVASGTLDPDHKPDFTNTAPAERIGPFPAWHNPEKIVSLDPFGSDVGSYFGELIAQGYDIRPTIAVTRAHINMPELNQLIREGKLKADGNILSPEGDCKVTKAAIEPVWHLPGVAKRFGVEESELRRCLFEYTGGMFPELVTRPDIQVFLPPIAGATVYFFGDMAAINAPQRKLAVRVHDECNGSDVFGSDICTCRPYLVHGIEVCIQTAQEGGAGLIVYNRKEGRALGEVTKFLVYNARKRQPGGDRAEAYFLRTECIAGVQDMRFQELMPDVLHWLGISSIDRFVSESNMKFDAVTKSGITIKERVSIPDSRIPKDARVEMDAKRAAGYFYAGQKPDGEELAKAKGRGLDE